MPSLARGESSTSTNQVLDLQLGTDVAVLEFRIFDISTPAKRGAPLQVYPPVAGTWAALDPTLAPPAGHRLGLGHYYAPWTVPLSEAIGDHLVEWQFKETVLDPYEGASEEFYVAEGATPADVTYVSVAEVRAEGFTDPPYTDERIEQLCRLATLFIDKVTGRWFTPRTFGPTNRLLYDGKGARVLHLEIPVIQLDRLLIEDQGWSSGGLNDVELAEVRVYNRHLSGMTQPDDRENPMIAFLGVGPAYGVADDSPFALVRRFPLGRQNVQLEGVFGYTDPDGSPYGETPLLIRQAALRLVIRDLRLESDACEKLNDKNRFRIVGDREGSVSVSLQALWLKGAFTGDPEIDQVLMAYKRPPRMAAV